MNPNRINAPSFSLRPRAMHKGDAGRLLVISGSRDFSGAPRLVGVGSLAVGAGLVRLMVPESIRAEVAGEDPALMITGMRETVAGTLAWPEALLGILPGGPRPEGTGGLIAVYINSELTQRFAVFGTMAILTVGFWVGAILAVDQVVIAIPRVLGGWCSAIVGGIEIPKPVLVGRFPTLPRFWGRSRGGVGDDPRSIPLRGRRRRSELIDDDDLIDEDAGGLGATESFDPDTGKGARRILEAEDEFLAVRESIQDSVKDS